MTTVRGRALAAAAAAAAIVAVAGCSGDGDETTPEESAQAEPTAQDRLEEAREALASTPSVQLLLEGTDIPRSEGAVVRAEGVGTTDPPAFDGVIRASISGIQADVDTVAIGADLWVKMPFTPSHLKTTAADMGVPDPARLFDPEEGVVALLSQTEDAEFGEQTRNRQEILQQITGTLPGAAVTDLLVVGDAEADYAVSYGLIEDDWQLRTVTLTGPFFPPNDSSYTLTLDGYGETAEITAP